ncbi:type VI secretion system Vgr family protein [Pseudomonas gingeri]|uniref:type VI secretion system Vgr family protein n=1 Tax=Pseudomonas gingeri TaxID=117681 RepID=UPI0015A0856A|nr:type VI secretion system tip protein VgrG [Pseudomonas gingeri]NWD04691.1 type VI secretion system tip protein VgrG [Pseudomonas gingeri]NWE30943.1 type VI secretion system tip protein VgrG [Pseudomonas gingeri]NWE59005.1 type VI secretion system tip protein VgrG [Pseudomonas gingeri]NWF02407.1 type VI secretion system tip protein VgrG [Pseudomonas gingeri]
MSTTQANRDISVTSVLGADTLLFRRMRATEALSELSEYNLDLYSERADLRIDDVLATPMTVAVDLPKGGKRYFNGIVSRFAMTGRQGRFATYQVTLRPWLWFLTLASDCRIFQDQSVPDILKAVFAPYTIADVDASGLSASYPTLTYCVQYRETDFNFVSRLMEQEGIYYFFKSANGRHTLVLADSYGAHEPAPGYAQVRYMPGEDQTMRESEVIYDWRMSGEVEPGAYSLQDFDFEKPSANLLVKSTQVRNYAQSRHERYDYPGRYTERKQGETYARSLIESFHTSYQRVHGETRARGLFPGALLTLTEHPRSDQNGQVLILDATYVLSSDTYEPTRPTDPEPILTCVFTALSRQQEFRPACRARKPLVQGPQTAMVVGKKGEEIWTDQYGRIKVQFHWDRLGQDDESSSCWVRVAQGWAGKRWGSLFTPRIGQEVIVSFLEGDPDQPLVTGSVYNAETMPPYGLPEHATRSTIKSNSSKGGGGYNELRFEDRKGAEQVFLHAQKDLDQRIEKDSLAWVGADSHSIVNKHLREHVGGDRHSSVGGDRNEKAGGSLSMAATQNMILESGLKCGLSGGIDVLIKAGMNVVIEAGASITLKAGAAFLTVGPAMIVASTIPIPLPQASTAANAMAIAAATGPAGMPLPPKEADDGSQ